MQEARTLTKSWRGPVSYQVTTRLSAALRLESDPKSAISRYTILVGLQVRIYMRKIVEYSASAVPESTR